MVRKDSHQINPKPLTKKGFEALIKKAVQPSQRPKKESGSKETQT